MPRSSEAGRPASTSRRPAPVAPAIRNIDRSVEFLDLVTAWHSFVAAAGRVVLCLRDRQLGDDERTIVQENVARVRATLLPVARSLRTRFPPAEARSTIARRDRTEPVLPQRAISRLYCSPWTAATVQTIRRTNQSGRNPVGTPDAATFRG